MPKNLKGKDIADIIPDKCIGCQLCVGECPVDAIIMKDGVAVIDKEKCTGCGKCFDICPAAAVLFEKVRPKKKAAAGTAPSPGEHHGVAVFIEVRQGHGADVAWELVGKARELAARLEVPVSGFLLGSGVGAVVEEAFSYGCDHVYVMDSPGMENYVSSVYGRALGQLCLEVRPEILLLGATPLGRDLAGVVATRLATGLTADCTGLDIEPETKFLLMTRPTFGGNIMATIACRTRRPQMATVRPKVMKLPQKVEGRRGEVHPVALETAEDNIPRILEVISRADLGAEDITKAPVLVVIGKGACDARRVPMFEELAHLLGGTIACSRPVVEAGLLPYVRQVGQTGKTVAPKVYIGVAVSGAVQHLVGIQGSEKIVAINLDRNAPMMQIADFALVGDYLEVVPALIEALKARQSQAPVPPGRVEGNTP